MISEPGWYIFDQGYSFTILQVFKYLPDGGCWSYNTLYSRKGDERTLNDGEDAFIFEGSAMHGESEPILEYKERNVLFNYIFNASDRFVMGGDYR